MKMVNRSAIAALTLAAALALPIAGAWAFDESKYPDFSGQWRRPPGIGIQWDQTKPLGRGQEAPLTPEYQKVFEASLADQAAGGQGNDPPSRCMPFGLPRIMSVIFPMEIVVTPKTTHILFDYALPRRIYTGVRGRRKLSPAFMAIPSAGGSTRMATAATTCSRSKRAVSKGRARTRQRASRSMKTASPSSRSVSLLTRPTPTRCMT